MGEPFERRRRQAAVRAERPGDPPRDAREHVLERDDLGEGDEPDFPQRPVEERVDHDAAQILVGLGLEGGEPADDPRALQEVAQKVRMRPLGFLVAPELLEQVVLQVGRRGRRRQREEEGEQLGRAQVRARDVLDEGIVPIRLRASGLQGLEFGGARQALDLPCEEPLDRRSQGAVRGVHVVPSCRENNPRGMPRDRPDAAAKDFRILGPTVVPASLRIWTSNDHGLYIGCMAAAFVEGPDRQLAEAISRLAYCNPFLPDRIEFERQALGDAFVPGGTLWHAAGLPEPPPNVGALRERAASLIERLAGRLDAQARPNAAALSLYEDVVIYLLFARYDEDFYGLIDERAATPAVAFYRKFRQDVERLLQTPRARLVADRDVPHLFAGFFQIRRAFHYIFHNIIGNSPPIVRLRATVWQSIFTRDMRRYRRSLYQRMGHFATLITGPSGSGTELVAQAIGLAGSIPFDAG